MSIITNNIANIIVFALLIGLVVICIRSLKKNGGTCNCGNCSGCSACKAKKNSTNRAKCCQ